MRVRAEQVLDKRFCEVFQQEVGQGEKISMLNLTRRIGEGVTLKLNGKTIHLRVLKTGGRVTLGFDAPREVDIIRDELLRAGPLPQSGQDARGGKPAAN